jgi:hypothetical protein
MITAFALACTIQTTVKSPTQDYIVVEKGTSPFYVRVPTAWKPTGQPQKNGSVLKIGIGTFSVTGGTYYLKFMASPSNATIKSFEKSKANYLKTKSARAVTVGNLKGYFAERSLPPMSIKNANGVLKKPHAITPPKSYELYLFDGKSARLCTFTGTSKSAYQDLLGVAVTMKNLAGRSPGARGTATAK